MNTVLLGFGCFYAVAKKPFEIPQIKGVLDKHENYKIVAKSLTIILAVVLAVFVGLLMLPFGIFKFFVYCYLQIKHGPDFGEFLNGLGASFLISEEQGVANTVMFVEYDDDIHDFRKKLKDVVRKTHEHFYHLRCTVNRCLGYYYLLKDQVEFEEIFKTISLNEKRREVLELDDVLDYLDGITITEEKTLWETVLFEQPVWLNGKKTYAVYCRHNHSIIDGFALSVVMYFAILIDDPSIKNMDKNIDLKKHQKSFTLDDCHLYKSAFDLHYDELAENRNQFTAYHIENQPEKVDKIRFVSKKLGIGYGDVVVASVIYGMSSLLDKKNIKFSGKFQLAITGSADIKNIENMVTGKTSTGSLSNSFFSIAAIVSKYEKDRSKSAFLKKIAEECGRVRKSLNPWIAYFTIKYILAVIPITLYQNLARNINRCMSLVFTNMAVHGKKTMCGRELVAHLGSVTVITNKSMYALTMCYNDRFVITISGRYDFLKSREDTRYVLDSALEYIEDVYEDLIQEKLEID